MNIVKTNLYKQQSEAYDYYPNDATISGAHRRGAYQGETHTSGASEKDVMR
jgi:hypothetical protein